MKRKIITWRTIGRKQMTIGELEQWQEEFEQFHAGFADLFERSESREQAKKYLRGLLAQADRKNSWQVAEVVGDAIPDRMQRLLYRVPWDAEAARDRLQQFVIETFGDEEGIGVVDETSFLKKGTHSVGVARQYLGVAGKLDNGQVATGLSYAAKGAHVFLDRRLYLPEEWAWDKERRAQARVPQEVRFETKPERAYCMLLHAWDRGVPMRWVTGDEVYGDSPRLRETIQAHGRFYVLAVSANTRVWTERPEVEEPQEQTGGRPRLALRVASEAPKARMVSEVVASLPSQAWKRMAVMAGEKGPLAYHWGRTRVVGSRGRLPGAGVWVVAPPPLPYPKKLSFYLGHVAATTAFRDKVRIGVSRYTVEQCIEEAKGETGLDEYEGRFW